MIRMPSLNERKVTVLRQAVMDRIKDDHNFPAFPMTIDKLNAVIARPNSGLAEVATIVETDPGLTARCLKLANSAAFAGTNRIESVRTAVMRLGIREIRRMTLSVSIIGSFSRLKVNVDWKKYWLHSVLTARLTEMLTGAYQEVSGREYLAGLIHDIGKLLMEHYFPNEFETIILRLPTVNDSLDLERQIMGITHAEICSLVAERWKLDGDIVYAVKHHHNSEHAACRAMGGNPRQRVQAICLILANRLANLATENIAIKEGMNGVTWDALPEWELLQDFAPRKELEFNLDTEVAKACETLEVAPSQSLAA